jgi:hypothetical protein
MVIILNKNIMERLLYYYILVKKEDFKYIYYNEIDIDKIYWYL